MFSAGGGVPDGADPARFDLYLLTADIEAPQFRMHSSSLIRMQSTSVRVDVGTHEEIKRLAKEMGATVGETVALAVRRLRQERMGQELAAPLRDNESAWLDAELG